MCPEYVLITPDVEEEFIKELKEVYVVLTFSYHSRVHSIIDVDS